MRTTPTHRNRMIAKIKIAQQQLAMDDDSYRAMLQRTTGKKSCKDLTATELAMVLREMERLGFVPTRPNPERKPLHLAQHGNMMRKISVLLTQHGKSWQYAHGIAKKMFGVDTVQQCDGVQIRKIIAALNYYAKRQV